MKGIITWSVFIRWFLAKFCLYIYIYIERERYRQTDKQTECGGPWNVFKCFENGEKMRNGFTEPSSSKENSNLGQNNCTTKTKQEFNVKT